MLCAPQASVEEMLLCVAASPGDAAGGKTARGTERSTPKQSGRDPPGLPSLTAGRHVEPGVTQLTRNHCNLNLH